MLTSFFRKKTFLISFVFLAISLSSCKKMLDPNPRDVVLEEDFPKDFWDADFMIRGAYQAFQPILEYKFIQGELRADWVKPGPGANQDMLELFNHNVSDRNKYTDWKPYYDMINRANYVIENVPHVPLDANFFSEYEKGLFLGEARFIRSWAYFNLVMNFNRVPLVLTAVDDISKIPYLGAVSEDEVLNFVEKDLDTAFQLTSNGAISVPNTFGVGKRISEETWRLRATKRTVCVLQAEVDLWRNKYDSAAAACNRYTTVGGGGTPGGTWFNMFWGAGNTNLFGGEIFFVVYDYLGREVQPMMQFTSNDPASGGQYMVAPSDSAIKTYHSKWPVISNPINTAQDDRRGFGQSFVGSAPYYNRVNSDPVIWKYLGTGIVTPGTANVVPAVRAPYASDARWSPIRMADIYLLWAEALNKLGDKATAITRINTVRAAAGNTGAGGMPNVTEVTTSTTTDSLESYILKERGLEFGFEGKRWFDLLRIARRRQAEQGGTAGRDFLLKYIFKRIPASDQVTRDAIRTRLTDSKNWYLPYNAEEKRLNPNLK
jgi:starch-binding outer membrane protein, SusD/RagB family